MDLIAFVLPGLVAPVAFAIQTKPDVWWSIVATAVAGLIVWLAVLRVASEIVFESDVDRLADLKPFLTDWRIREPPKKTRGRPALTVDVVALVGTPASHVLLVRRGKPPFDGRWALPGGYVEENESVTVAARRELREETGIDVSDLSFVGIYDAVGRDPRGWTISIAYRITLGAAGEAHGADDVSEAAWFSLDHVPPLAFDHDAIVAEAIRSSQAP